MSHRWLLALALLLVAVVLSGVDASAAKRQSAHDKFYEHAIELIAKGDHKGAIIELKNALQADPKDIAARVLLGNTYLEVEDGASAAKEFLRARRDGARDSFVLAPLGRAYVLQGRYKKALKELSAAGQDQTTAAEIAIIRGDAHLALRDYREAESSYLAASKIRPSDARPLIGLARVKLANDDMLGALNYIKWSLEANPSDPRAWYIQGEVREKNGETDEALKSYDRAIELAPEFPRARLARASIRIERKQYDEAEVDIRAVRKVSPYNPRATYLQSLVLSHRGKVKEAQDLLIEAEQTLMRYPTAYIMNHPPTALLAGVITFFRGDLDSSYRLLSHFSKQVPQHTGARKLLASIALTRGEPKIALQILQPLNPARSTDVELLTMYGDALTRVKRYSEANIILDRAAKTAEPGSSSLFKLVVVRLTANQNAEAIKLLQSEMKSDPNAVRAAIMLGTAQLKSRDFKAALKTLNAVTERQPDNAVAHNLAGGAHLGLGEVQAARDRYKAAIDAEPDYLHAMENLAKVEARLGNLDDAVELFTAILKKDSKNGKAMILLADISRQRKELDEAFRWLEKARTSSRDSHAASLRLIPLYIRADRMDDAMQVARELYSKDPSKFEFILAYGQASLAAKKLDQAVVTFRNLAIRAAELNSADRLHRAATWQLQARDKQGAKESLNKALEIDNKHIPTHVELFRLEMAAGDLNAALARGRRLATQNSASPAGHMMMGDANMRLQRFKPAIVAYDAALRNSDTVELAERAFNARRAAGQDGLQFVKDWVSKRSDEPGAERLLAIAYSLAGQNGDAIQIYERLLKKIPNNIVLLNDMALLYQRAGNPKALDFARRAYDFEPENPATIDTYGWILVLNGNVDEGLALLRNAKLRAPHVPEIRYHLAVALKEQGKIEKARSELRDALRNNLPFEGRSEAEALLAKLLPKRQ